MARPSEFNDEFVAGDSYKLSLTYKEADDPIDLTDYMVRIQLRRSTKSEEPAIDETWVISAEDGILGLIIIAFSSDETELLINESCNRSTKYLYDVEITDPTGEIVTTLLMGKFEVLTGITR